jgi:hypothetical protein
MRHEKIEKKVEYEIGDGRRFETEEIAYLYVRADEIARAMSGTQAAGIPFNTLHQMMPDILSMAKGLLPHLKKYIQETTYKEE